MVLEDLRGGDQLKTIDGVSGRRQQIDDQGAGTHQNMYNRMMGINVSNSSSFEALGPCLSALKHYNTYTSHTRTL